MDKDTKIELLKIFAMVVILIMLIIGIVWMNKEDKDQTITDQSEETVENEFDEEMQSEENTESVDNENNDETENKKNADNIDNVDNNDTADEKKPDEQTGE